MDCLTTNPYKRACKIYTHAKHLMHLRYTLQSLAIVPVAESKKDKDIPSVVCPGSNVLNSAGNQPEQH